MSPKKLPPKLPEPEWSYWVNTDEIPPSGLSKTISPEPAQLPLVARRVGVERLESLVANVNLSKAKGGVMVHVKGTLQADIVQDCVVTLEPIQSQINEEFEGWFADQDRVVLFEKAQRESLTKREMMDLPILEEHEDPEPLENGKVNVGELVVQYLSLAIDPFPHKEGKAREQKPETAPRVVSQEALRLNPFAALKNWRPKD